MNILWKMPFPSSGLFSGPTLVEHAGRLLGLKFSGEDKEYEIREYELQFANVCAFKCTYLPALTSDLIASSYDRLVELGNTDWLLQAQNSANRAPSLTAPSKHLRICFDDGPCYEFLCSAFAFIQLDSGEFGSYIENTRNEGALD